MLKMKTIQSVKKRFKKTSIGNFKYKHANLRHLLTLKSTKRKRYLRSKSILSTGDARLIKNCLPYI